MKKFSTRKFLISWQYFVASEAQRLCEYGARKNRQLEWSYRNTRKRKAYKIKIGSFLTMFGKKLAADLSGVKYILSSFAFMRPKFWPLGNNEWLLLGWGGEERVSYRQYHLLEVHIRFATIANIWVHSHHAPSIRSHIEGHKWCFPDFPANESLRRTGLHWSLSAKSSFYLPVFEISRSCRTASDFQPMRVSEEQVCIGLCRPNPVFTSLHLRSPYRLWPPAQDNRFFCRYRIVVRWSLPSWNNVGWLEHRVHIGQRWNRGSVTLYVMVRGWAPYTPHPHQPGLIFPSWWDVRQKYRQSPLCVYSVD